MKFTGSTVRGVQNMHIKTTGTGVFDEFALLGVNYSLTVCNIFVCIILPFHTGGQLLTHQKSQFTVLY